MAQKTSHLPPEIIEIILSNLPVKPLLRFKSISKSWNTIISDPVFAQNHLQRSKNSNSGNLFLCHDANLNLNSSSSRFSVVKLEDRKFQTLQVIESTCEWVEYLCCCEGVILLLTDRTNQRFTLWNPSTRTLTELRHPDRSNGVTVGLCHDPITDDFKVVIMNWFNYSVYSCNNKSWMSLEKEYEIENAGLGILTCNNIPVVCVDGTSYWLSNWGWWNPPNILYYDPRDDKLKILHMPKNLELQHKPIYLVGLGGRLCLYYNGRDKNTVEIWTKGKGIDNNNWKELMTVANVGMQIRDFQPLCFVGNKIVIRNRGLDRLLVYNPCEKTFEEFEEDTRVFGSVRVPIPYMERLFSPF